MALYPRKLSSLILILFCHLFALSECYLPYRCTHLINGFLHIIQQVKAKIKTTIKEIFPIILTDIQNKQELEQLAVVAVTLSYSSNYQVLECNSDDDDVNK
jgi:hypothetical protein